MKRVLDIYKDNIQENDYITDITNILDKVIPGIIAHLANNGIADITFVYGNKTKFEYSASAGKKFAYFVQYSLNGKLTEYLLIHSLNSINILLYSYDSFIRMVAHQIIFTIMEDSAYKFQIWLRVTEGVFKNCTGQYTSSGLLLGRYKYAQKLLFLEPKHVELITDSAHYKFDRSAISPSTHGIVDMLGNTAVENDIIIFMSQGMQCGIVEGYEDCESVMSVIKANSNERISITNKRSFLIVSDNSKNEISNQILLNKLSN